MIRKSGRDDFWKRNHPVAASRNFARELFLAKTIQPHHFGAFARLGRFGLALGGGLGCRNRQGRGRGNGGEVLPPRPALRLRPVRPPTRTPPRNEETPS